MVQRGKDHLEAENKRCADIEQRLYCGCVLRWRR
nr:MAG TPA: hypothetical protein [Caudoviricetes sp.]